MRRCLKILGWMGMGISAVLFVATVVLWVRSLGHHEGWYIQRFEAHPEWDSPALRGMGTCCGWHMDAIRGRLELNWWTEGPWSERELGTGHFRQPISEEKAVREFEDSFPRGERPWFGGVERGWRFAGAGVVWARDQFHTEMRRLSKEAFGLAIPLWMPAVLFGLWPTLFILRRVLRRKRYGPGMCPNCGYDLRATPQRCPECGREVVGKGS